MTYFSDIFQLKSSRRDILFGSALLIAIFAGAILWYGPKYDYPSGSTRVESAPIKLLGRKGVVTVSCEDCPPYLIAQRERSVTFHVTVKLDSVAEPSPSVGTSMPSSSVPKALDFGFTAEAKTAGIDSQSQFITKDADLIARLEATESITLNLKPADADFAEVVFSFQHYEDANPSAIVENPAHIDFRLPTRTQFSHVLQPIFYSLLIFVLALVILYSMDRKYRLLQQEEEQRLQAARTKAADNPNQASPAWELAGANLQRYFTRNLAQVRQVFYVSVGVMIVGFGFVLYGVYEQVMWQSAWLEKFPTQTPNIIPPTWIASISGLITQFIGATFMVIYKSTMAQANEFVTVLDRINTVGIAMKVLDQIPDTDKEKTSARQKLIDLLLSSRPKQPTHSSATHAVKKKARSDHAASNAPHSGDDD